MFITDRAAALPGGRTADGFLHLTARIGRTGLHLYEAGELGLPGPPARPVRVWRDAAAVFAPESVASFAGVPLTLGHPPAMIDSGSWSAHAVGHVLACRRDGDHLAANLVVTDAMAVARAEAGVELSNGYWADFDFTPGTAPDGTPYEARQVAIRGNHVALVDHGRCGPTCRIEPAIPGSAPCSCPPEKDDAMTDRRTATIDGVTVETNEAGAAALSRLAAALSDARTAHRREIAARDREILALRRAAPEGGALDALVAERVAVQDAARAVLGRQFDPRGLGTAALRRAVVARLVGPELLEDRDDGYVAAVFDGLMAARRPGNPLASALAAAPTGTEPREDALAARNRYLAAAWKGEPATGDR